MFNTPPIHKIADSPEEQRSLWTRRLDQLDSLLATIKGAAGEAPDPSPQGQEETP